MLAQSAIFLAAAVALVPLFARLGLGSVLGYLVAGLIIGPAGLGLISNVEQTMHIAEFGVVLLLFLIGLELQPSRLWNMRHAVFGLGGAQVSASAALITVIARALGCSWTTALVVGLSLSLSSTAFAMQTLGEKNELGTPHGRAAFGILLFQDLAAIPMLAFIPLLGAGAAERDRSPVYIFLIVGIIVSLVVVGRYLLRPAFRFIAQAHSHELSVASALLVVVATALLMQSVGLSMALGAFMAGVLLADSEYRHELEANIEPFKGLLLGLFFMAVGMAVDIGIVLERPLAALLLTLGLVVTKSVVLFGLGRAAGNANASAASLAVAASQGGEFAYVILGVARATDVVDTELSELLVIVVTLSMAMTPLLFFARDYALKRLAEREKNARPFDAIDDEGSRVIIAGFGRFGQIVARVLRLKHIPFTALDASPTHVDFVRRFGNKIYYGDASRVDLLRAARAEHAELFVLAIDDPDASMRTLKTVQAHFPHLKIIARARNRQHAYALLGAGVTIVIRETFAGSVEAARITLEELGLPSSEARETVRTFADYDEAMVRKMYVHREDEKVLIESAKQYSAELERLFEQDARAAS